MKICTRCGKEKELTQFYLSRNGQYSTYCRECSNTISREYHAANREKRVKQIEEYRHRNRDFLYRREHERLFSPEHRSKKADKLKKWREENREHVHQYNRSPKVKARAAVNHLVRAGRFPPAITMVCDECQEAQAAEWHHHKGYEGEFKTDVVALCTECHGKVHRL